MVPQSLDEWTLDCLCQLLETGYKESEHFDYKEMLPHKANKVDKLGLRKDCCAVTVHPATLGKTGAAAHGMIL
jgi:hypothetical protein